MVIEECHQADRAFRHMADIGQGGLQGGQIGTGQEGVDGRWGVAVVEREIVGDLEVCGPVGFVAEAKLTIRATVQCVACTLFVGQAPACQTAALVTGVGASWVSKWAVERGAIGSRKPRIAGAVGQAIEAGDALAVGRAVVGADANAAVKSCPASIARADTAC